MSTTRLDRFDPAAWLADGMVVAPFPVRLRRVVEKAAGFLRDVTISLAFAGVVATSSAAVGLIVDTHAYEAPDDAPTRGSDDMTTKDWATVERLLGSLPPMDDPSNDPDVEDFDFSV